MPWTVQYTKQAERQLKKFGSEVEKRIRKFMSDRVSRMENPVVLAKKLTGQYESLMRYRAGDYRIVCEIQNQILIIVVVAVAHRREAYR